jgi:D-xylose transport system permease protein
MSNISEPVDVSSLADNNQQSFNDYARERLGRLRAGDLGSLPIIFGLILIFIIFGLASPVFFSARNFVNLLLQTAPIAAIAIGVVFVLLIAEIDLSVGFVGAVGGVTMTLLLLEPSPALPWYVAIGAGLLAVTLIGLVQGLIITRAGVPSFVVTLAGLLIWSGVVLILTTEFTTSGTIVIQDAIVLGIANSFLPTLWGWVLFAFVAIAYAASQISQYVSLNRRGLGSKPLSVLILQIAFLTVLVGAAVFYANRDRGIPTVAVIVVLFFVIWSFIAGRTRFGRYVYAVGGNPEAARRAGIGVNNIRVIVFMISSFMAGVGGIILASRLRSVDTGSGGGNLLLNVIAAAVIGGTSLFGGVGSVSSAILGALIIASVENGMGLLGLPSGVKFVVNGSVLLFAVLIDAFSRRSREASGIL